MNRPARWSFSLVLGLLPFLALPGARAADSGRHSDVPVPAAAGSQSPRLARGAEGTVVLSWLEPAGEAWALRYARWGGGGWLPPATVEMGDNWFVNWADLPAVTPVREDFWVAHWLVRRPAGGYAYDIHVAVSVDSGRSFSPPVSAHRDGTDTEHGFVSVFPAADGAGLVWLDGRQTAGGAGMTLRSATLLPAAELSERRLVDDLVCDCCQTAATVTRSGPLVVYRNRTDAEVRDIHAAREIDGAWQAGVPVSRDGWVIEGCPVNGPAVESADDEVVVAWFTAAEGRPRVRLARAAGGELAFSAALDVLDGDTLGRVGLALLDDGSAVVSALRPGTDSAALLTLTRVSRGGDVGTPYILADGLSGFSVPQLVRTGDTLLAVWPATADDGGRALRSALLPVADLD